MPLDENSGIHAYIGFLASMKSWIGAVFVAYQFAEEEQRSDTIEDLTEFAVGYVFGYYMQQRSSN